MSSWHALHFNKIASVIRSQRVDAEIRYTAKSRTRAGIIAVLNEQTLLYAEYFRRNIVGFDTQKFIDACGFKS